MNRTDRMNMRQDARRKRKEARQKMREERANKKILKLQPSELGILIGVAVGVVAYALLKKKGVFNKQDNQQPDTVDAEYEIVNDNPMLPPAKKDEDPIETLKNYLIKNK